MSELYEDTYKKEFSFGANWEKFLKKLSSRKINLAKESLLSFTKKSNFNNLSFLDVGCGSGLFSLSAVLLGAKKVVSVDVDENSLSCARALKKKYNIEDSIWEIKKMSALNPTLQSRQFDIVYSWGVLHHTGAMNKAMENIANIPNSKGLLYIALYNDFKGFPISSKTWRIIKRFYAKSPRLIRYIMEKGYISAFFLALLILGKSPRKYVENYEKISIRGMDFYRDVEDWLGGYPFEFASVEKVKLFYEKRDFKLINLNRTKREGCNEFLFTRIS